MYLALLTLVIDIMLINLPCLTRSHFSLSYLHPLLDLTLFYTGRLRSGRVNKERSGHTLPYVSRKYLTLTDYTVSYLLLQYLNYQSLSYITCLIIGLICFLCLCSQPSLRLRSDGRRWSLLRKLDDGSSPKSMRDDVEIGQQVHSLTEFLACKGKKDKRIPSSSSSLSSSSSFSFYSFFLWHDREITSNRKII